MKQLLFVCLGLLLSASVSSAGTVNKIMKHPEGGCHPPATGFSSVDFSDDDGNITLICSGCGDMPCSATIITPAEASMFGYADSQIASGTLSGSYTDPTSGYHVNWTATDVFDATETVTAP